MSNKQPRQVNPQELQFLGRLSGLEIAPERLGPVAQEVTILLQNLSALDPMELQAVEPATIFPSRLEPTPIESKE